MFWSISEGVSDIASHMIEYPEDWEQNMYSFINIKHPSIAIWTSNGTSFINLRGNACFTLAEKYCIANAIKKSIANRIRKGAR